MLPKADSLKNRMLFSVRSSIVKLPNNVTVNESLKAAHDLGTSLYSIDPMSSSYIPPSYFDYYSNGKYQ